MLPVKDTHDEMFDNVEEIMPFYIALEKKLDGVGPVDNRPSTD